MLIERARRRYRRPWKPRRGPRKIIAYNPKVIELEWGYDDVTCILEEDVPRDTVIDKNTVIIPRRPWEYEFVPKRRLSEHWTGETCDRKKKATVKGRHEKPKKMDSL